MSTDNQKRLIAIDYGEKRVGIAVTDPLKMFAYPLVTLSNDSKLIDEIKSLLNEYECEKIILGLPLKESGEHSKSTEAAIKFKEKLESSILLPVEFMDERYSSSIARERIIEGVKSKKKRRDKGLIDRNAACIILEDYLSSISLK